MGGDEGASAGSSPRTAGTPAQDHGFQASSTALARRRERARLEVNGAPVPAHLRWIREAPDGSLAILQPDASWRLYTWSPPTMLDLGENAASASGPVDGSDA